MQTSPLFTKKHTEVIKDNKGVHNILEKMYPKVIKTKNINKVIL